jgi:hypothetical protein
VRIGNAGWRNRNVIKLLKLPILGFYGSAVA